MLTSMIKKFDVAVYELVRDFLDDDLDRSSRVLALADDAVGYSTTGGHLLPDTSPRSRARGRSCPARGPFPLAERGARAAPSARSPATVTFDGATCRYDGPTCSCRATSSASSSSTRRVTRRRST